MEGETLNLGTYGAAAAECARALGKGLPLSTLTFDSGNREIGLLGRRLAGHGLLEYSIGRADNETEDLVVIESQVLGYWPQLAQLDDVDVLTLSRFAYMRRHGDAMVLESPRADALFKFLDPRFASFIASLATPRRVKEIRQHDGFFGMELLALLVDSNILFKCANDSENSPRSAEGDHSLILWDFHDLLFHVRSTEGRHANPLGGLYPHEGAIPPLPAVRPSWPGEKIDLCAVLTPTADNMAPVAKLLRLRHSTRDYDDRRPITVAELSQFLDRSARILSRADAADIAAGRPETARPYPSAGASYELELYLAINNCEGLPQGLYHYDSGAHALVPIDASANDVKALLIGATYAMGVEAAPQVLITITARFGRVSWKYSSLAYSLILKDAGVLTQTLYMVATEMGLGGCAIGFANIDRFEKMTGIGFHIEGPVGQFALGREARK